MTVRFRCVGYVPGGVQARFASVVTNGRRRMCAGCVRVVPYRWYALLRRGCRAIAWRGDARSSLADLGVTHASVLPFAVTKWSLVEFVASQLPVGHDLVEQRLEVLVVVSVV